MNWSPFKYRNLQIGWWQTTGCLQNGQIQTKLGAIQGTANQIQSIKAKDTKVKSWQRSPMVGWNLCYRNDGFAKTIYWWKDPIRIIKEVKVQKKDPVGGSKLHKCSDTLSGSGIRDHTEHPFVYRWEKYRSTEDNSRRRKKLPSKLKMQAIQRMSIPGWVGMRLHWSQSNDFAEVSMDLPRCFSWMGHWSIPGLGLKSQLLWVPVRLNISQLLVDLAKASSLWGFGSSWSWRKWRPRWLVTQALAGPSVNA